MKILIHESSIYRVNIDYIHFFKINICIYNTLNRREIKKRMYENACKS